MGDDDITQDLLNAVGTFSTRDQNSSNQNVHQISIFLIMEVPIVQSNINKEPFQRPFLRALGKEFLPYDFPKPFQSDFVYQ